MELLTDRYQDKISGVLSCFDRIVLTGTIPGICFSKGMTSYLYSKNIKIFDYKEFAQKLREELRTNTEEIAEENNIEIEYINKKGIRKEDIIQKKIKKRGDHPGLIAIISTMETCTEYKPWHDKKTHRTFLKGGTGKCLHYYFYFIHEVLGLMYVRLPTWCPFRAQVYFNGHNYLATKLREENIDYHMIDNAFSRISNFERAQEIADNLSPEELHEILDEIASRYCPFLKTFNSKYHWSIMQVEYATDIVFKIKEDLQNIYDELVATAIHTVKPDNISTFLGKKLDPRYQDELGNNYHVRIEGSCIKHKMGKNSIKMYDKHKKVLRIETTSNDISFFKNYRKVEHKDGTVSHKNAPMKKNIYSLSPLKNILLASNRRYLEFISAIDDKSIGKKKLEKVSNRTIKKEIGFKGINFFSKDDQEILEVVARGEFNLSGFQRKNLCQLLLSKSKYQVSRILQRLRAFGLIKKIGRTYKYYLTKLGKEVIATATKLREIIVIPKLNTRAA